MANLETVNPLTLDALLAVLERRGVVGFELVGPDGGKLTVQLAPRAPELPAAPPIEVVDTRPGGWKDAR